MKINDTIKPKLLVHIGYHKTGTTYWQEKIFSADNINLIERLSIRKNLLSSSPYSFSSKKLNDWLVTQLSNDKLNVISEEELLGNIHTAGNGRSITYETIERLSKIEVADVFILLFIRNQVQIVDSCYRQYVKKGGCFSFENYIKPENKGAFRHRFPGFSLEHFKYSDVIKHCYNKFHKGTVFVYPYEKFLLNPDSIIEDLSKILDTRLIIKEQHQRKFINKSLSNFSVRLARLSNRLFNHDPINRSSIFGLNFLQPIFLRFYLMLDSLLPKKMIVKTYVSDELKVKLEEYYTVSNQSTKQLTGLELEQFKYPGLLRSDEE